MQVAHGSKIRVLRSVVFSRQKKQALRKRRRGTHNRQLDICAPLLPLNFPCFQQIKANSLVQTPCASSLCSITAVSFPCFVWATRRSMVLRAAWPKAVHSIKANWNALPSFWSKCSFNIFFVSQKPHDTSTARISHSGIKRDTSRLKVRSSLAAEWRAFYLSVISVITGMQRK